MVFVANFETVNVSSTLLRHNLIYLYFSETASDTLSALLCLACFGIGNVLIVLVTNANLCTFTLYVVKHTLSHCRRVGAMNSVGMMLRNDANMWNLCAKLRP